MGLTQWYPVSKKKIKIWQELVNEHKYFEPKGHNHKYKGILLSQCWLTQSKWVFAHKLKWREMIYFSKSLYFISYSWWTFPAVTSGITEEGCIFGASLTTSSPAVCRTPQQCSGPVLSALGNLNCCFTAWDDGQVAGLWRRLLVLTTCLYLKVHFKWNTKKKNWSEGIYIKLTTLVAFGDGAETWAQVWGQRRLQFHLIFSCV